MKLLWVYSVNTAARESSIPLHVVAPPVQLRAPAPAPAPAQLSRFYRPELDVLRFVAFLGVFLVHGVALNPHGLLQAHPLLFKAATILCSTGRFGLSLFFLLSSFLITTLLLLEQERSGKIDLRSFYMRRTLRIWPLYYSFLLFTYLLGLLWSAVHFSLAALLCFSFLSANWYVIAISGKLVFSVGPLWSISLEEQFYLLWPSLVRRMRRKLILRVSLGLSFAGLLGVYILARSGANSLQLWFNSISEMIFFTTGALLALRFGLKEQQKSMLKACGGSAACLVLWCLAAKLGFVREEAAPRVWPLVYALDAAGAASLLWAFLHLPRFFIRRPLVYLGRISYGLYVFHGLLLIVGEHVLRDRCRLRHSWILITLPFIVGAAALSYEYVEKPFLRLKHHFEIVHSRAA